MLNVGAKQAFHLSYISSKSDFFRKAFIPNVLLKVHIWLQDNANSWGGNRAAALVGVRQAVGLAVDSAAS